ncbi:hypothetical protein [Sinanaerobacter chloroacetimidivorans]|uniref:Uncharacterized protein n=1 Tax=Sinanaerobacter chloroacetimidivorans TaxID=2818044 RepID=A0A8J7W159_9FIRM|nr:hypothetical protein [Sinanaerobacter chloroacetimidivorans]MBR0598489.1 hypothetical protein [Sinanaerobacter chloroacetimidivorans]
MIWINQQQEQGISHEQMSLIKDLRFLMTQFAYLTRDYIKSIIYNLGDSAAIANKLHNIPLKIKALVDMIFGASTGDELINLLLKNVSYLEDIVNAMLFGHFSFMYDSIKYFYHNADALAKYFAQINPYWDESQWKKLLYIYNEDLINDTNAIISRSFKDELDMFDKLLQDALAIADYLAEGINQYSAAQKK